MSTSSDRHPIRIGALLWPQQTDWPSLASAATTAEAASLDSLWTWDHLHAIVGDPRQPIYEGWTTLAAWAVATSRIELGLMVGANTFRNPGLTLKTAVTVDHISGGRTWLGLGGAWFEYEHIANGIDFGSGFGQRLDWLDEAVAAMSRVAAGEVVTSEAGGAYAFRDLQHHPRPLGRLPIMIGGSGEKRTLRTVARYAQGWNAGGSVDVMRHKVGVLERHCADVGRDPAEIERTLVVKASVRDTREDAVAALQERLRANDTADDVEPGLDFVGDEADVAAQWAPYVELGFRHLIVDVPAPYDMETIQRLARVRELAAGHAG
jgi:alkanesulfonate monooxygenase SsuD/methylene tetrahydromethanopterin reductase-like flavin-dependent oxidoreductase (luciferase family)